MNHGRELVAGITTFLTMSYMILVYPQMMGSLGLPLGSCLTSYGLITLFSTAFLALFANYPALLGPGLTVLVALVYGVQPRLGASIEELLAISFWAGAVIFCLSLFRFRQLVLLEMPLAIRRSSVGTIGLFLIQIAAQNGAVFSDPLGIPSLIACLGTVGLVFLFSRGVKGSYLIVVLLAWAAAASFGEVEWKGLVSVPERPNWIMPDLLGVLHPKFLPAILSVFLIALFDTSASIATMTHLLGPKSGHARLDRLDRQVIPDGAMSMVGSFLGTTTICFIIESTAGIRSGGRYGWTALFAGCLVLLSLFFAPLIASIPIYATSPAIAAIGISMAKELKRVNLSDPSDWIPALASSGALLSTGNLYLGFASAFLSYTLIKVGTGRSSEIHPVCWVLASLFALHLIVAS
jgi:AGZA family xanthine/uracil permease-like MFS transporter